jgi:hypothetical protein
MRDVLTDERRGSQSLFWDLGCDHSCQFMDLPRRHGWEYPSTNRDHARSAKGPGPSFDARLSFVLRRNRDRSKPRPSPSRASQRKRSQACVTDAPVAANGNRNRSAGRLRSYPNHVQLSGFFYLLTVLAYLRAHETSATKDSFTGCSPRCWCRCCRHQDRGCRQACREV